MACGHFSQPGTAHRLTAADLPGTLHLKTQAKFTPAAREKHLFQLRRHIVPNEERSVIALRFSDPAINILLAPDYLNWASQSLC